MNPDEYERLTAVSSSWIDRLVRWIDSLPGPVWLFYALLLPVLVLLNNAVFWIDGGVLLGSFYPSLSMFALYTLYWLALYQYLSNSASKALEEFRPLLDVSDSEFQRLDLELRTLPRNIGLLALPVGIATSLAAIPGDLEYALGQVGNSAQTALPAVYYTTLSSFLSAVFLGLIFRTFRQLRLVGKLHEQATNIDLLDLDPPHAFSALTARTGAGLILLLILISITFDAPIEITTVDVLTYVAIASLAVLVFIVPLYGMHSRLQDEKRSEQLRVNDLLRTVTDRLYQSVENKSYKDVEETDQAIEALLRQRDLLQKISSWPWNPGTIRGFTSTLLLPIFLLLVAQLLDLLL